MENLYKLPVIYGTACYKNNQCAICYVDEKGKTHLVNKKNKMQIIKHNIFFVRGLEYLIFGLWYFFANLICVNLYPSKISSGLSKNLNVTAKQITIFVLSII